MKVGNWIRSGSMVLFMGAATAPAMGTDNNSWDEENNAALQRGGADLNAAHEAFLARDFDRMALKLHDALQKSANDPGFVANAAKLMHRAYAESDSHRVNPDWHLGDGIEALRVGQLRRDSDAGTRYIFRVSGALANLGTLDQITVSYAGGDVILDKINKIGEYDEGNFHADKWFNIAVGRRSQPFADGLYTFTIRMRSGGVTNGWFILHDSVASAVPTILSPREGETITTGTPTVRWSPFRSPEYESFERRSMTASVRLDDEAGTTKWEFDGPTADADQMTVGDMASNTQGVSSLEDGAYSITVAYREARKFGDMYLRRESAKRIPVVVAKSK